MAERYLVSSGFSNDSAIYDGGTIPAPDDILRLNGYVLTQNSDIMLSELRNDANSPQGVVSGGFLQVQTSGLTTIADVYYNAGNYCYLVNNVDTHTLIGKFTANFGTLATRGLYLNNTFNGKMTIIGDIIANVGCCIGSVAPVGARLEIFGNLYNSANISQAISFGNLEVTVNGLAYSSTYPAPVISSTLFAGSVKVQGAIMSLGGTNLFAGDVRFMSNPLFVVIDENGNPLPLTDPATADHALPQDVRFGVVYNNGGLVGTSKMPAREVVSKDVVFDNGTVGEAILTAESVAQAAAQVVGAQFNAFKG